MNYFGLLTICISVILGICGVASIFVNGWVKASHIAEIKTNTGNQIEVLKLDTNNEIKILRDDINKLWEKVSKVEVLSSKLDALEKGIDEVKEMIRSKKEI